jgi:hypothetical protein
MRDALLQDALRQESVQVDSITLLSADLKSLGGVGSGTSSGGTANVGAIAGGVIAAIVAAAAITTILAVVCVHRKRMQVVDTATAATQPPVEYKAKPFWCASSSWSHEQVWPHTCAQLRCPAIDLDGSLQLVDAVRYPAKSQHDATFADARTITDASEGARF